ncbi:MAG: hypothetical protein RSA23_09995 [Carnobacterium sp.]
MKCNDYNWQGQSNSTHFQEKLAMLNTQLFLVQAGFDATLKKNTGNNINVATIRTYCNAIDDLEGAISCYERLISKEQKETKQ